MHGFEQLVERGFFRSGGDAPQQHNDSNDAHAPLL
jgi:hypothetical protein